MKTSLLPDLLTWTLLISALCGLSACSDSDQTAGGGIETTNGGFAVQGQVILADGTPAVSARVTARTAWIRNDVRQTRTDSAGLFRMNLPSSGHWILESADGDGRGYIQHLLRSEQQEPLVLSPFVLVGRLPLYGKLLCEKEQCNGTLDLPDLGLYDQQVGSFFTLNGIPRTPFHLQARSGTGWFFEGRVTPHQWNDTLTVNLSRDKRILLDDFEADNDVHEATFFPEQEGKWWIDSDSVEPSLWSPACFPCVTTTQIGKGSALHVRSDEQYNGGSLRIGVWFRQDPTLEKNSWLDLRALQTISFQARGKGQVRMELVTQKQSKDPDGREFGSRFGLSEEWTAVHIEKTSLSLEQQSTPWDSAASQVAGIVFIIPPETEFWLDDLTLHGLSLSEFE